MKIKKLVTILTSLIMLVCSLAIFGCTPLQENKVNMKYYQDASEINPLILSGKETIGLIPEPAATALQKNAQNKGMTLYRLDLQELYDDVDKSYPQAVLMVKKSVIGAHDQLEQTLNQKITDSVAWAKLNAGDAVTAISNHGATTLKAPALSASVIDACKIYWQSAENAKTSVKNYINSIIKIDSAKAKAVSDDFFYAQESLTNQKTEYSFVMPDGAPALAISKLMNDNDQLDTGKTINYSVVTAGQIRTHLTEGSADFILAPVNMASQFYKTNDQTDHYVMVAVITHGNFYIISTEKLTIDQLAGKQIAVPMMGAVPDWTLKMVLEKHNLSYVTVE